MTELLPIKAFPLSSGLGKYLVSGQFSFSVFHWSPSTGKPRVTPVPFTKTMESYKVSLVTSNQQTLYDSSILHQGYGIFKEVCRLGHQVLSVKWLVQNVDDRRTGSRSLCKRNKAYLLEDFSDIEFIFVLVVPCQS